MKLSLEKGGIGQRILDAGDAGMWPKIGEVLRRKIREAPKDPELRSRLGLALRQEGELIKAAEVYRELSNLAPEDEEAKFLANICGQQDLDFSAADRCLASPFFLHRNFLPPDRKKALFDLLTKEQQNLKQLEVAYPGEDDPEKVTTKIELEDGRNQLGVSRQNELREIFEDLVRKELTDAVRAMCREPLVDPEFRWRLDVTPDKGFARIHQDILRPNDLLTVLFYYNTQPKRFTGGDLLIYDRLPEDPELPRADHFTTIRHEDNLLVIFPNERFHQVTRVRCDSSSIFDARLSVVGFASRKVV